MSYVARDVRGYLGDLASIGGWATFARWARGRRKRPALAALLREGWAPAAALVADLEAGPATGDAESTRRNLLALARRAEEILILSDGVGDEDEGSEA